MTEDEAKTKWCPMVRLRNILDVSVRSGHASPGPDSDTFCVGSRCMAWRAQHQWLDNAQAEPDWVSYSPYAFEPGPGQERDDGYCGLVGAPQ